LSRRSAVEADSRKWEVLSEFGLDLRLRGRSSATISHYCLHVRLFLRAVEVSVFHVSDGDVRRYISSLYGAGYALNTIKLKVRALRQFYGYLHRTGRVLLNPTEGIKEPSALRLFPKSVLTPEEMNAIRRSIPRRSLVNLRDIAIIEVLFSTGIRLGELVALDIVDVDLIGGILTIRKGKGGVGRQAILTGDAIKALRQYLDLRRRIPDESPALWINYRGSRLSGQMIRLMLKGAGRRSGVETAVHPHAWRHGLATELLRRGASIREVQVFLGHKSIKTTEIYTHLTIRDLVEVHRRTHPRERDYEKMKGEKAEWSISAFRN